MYPTTHCGGYVSKVAGEEKGDLDGTLQDKQFIYSLTDKVQTLVDTISCFSVHLMDLPE